MHGSLNKSDKSDKSIYEKWGIGFLALPLILLIVLFALAVIQPVSSNWIAEAVQAELTGTDVLPDVAPTQLARPAMQFRDARAN
ncbi:MAG TPA: hypothetical protein VKS24_10605 [Bradyrhizobium sp.]|nr:hypothetical protein [Bradyrhizobium sp.]